MIVPSIDLMLGQAVQLIGGEALAIEAGDPMPIAAQFAVAGELAVIDLDAALGRGQNSAAIQNLVDEHRCRVGGGIRDLAAAIRWLDAGAEKVILGTAAEPDLLRQLPRERVIAALDARHGEVVVEGWQRGTGRELLPRIAELREHVGGFLVTFVEREGRLGGIDLEQVARVVKAAGSARVTVAGGVTTAEEVAAIDRLGADCQVGMALYTHTLELADAIVAPMHSDRPDGLWPTVVVDELGRALGLAWSDGESVREAVRCGRGVYRSRKRGLWRKGETSGASQQLLAIDLDCDRDALRFTVRQRGAGFCHQDRWTCWGDDAGLGRLQRRLAQRVATSPPGSYTRRLLEDPELLASKLLEEAKELVSADPRMADEVAWEAADVFYFTFVAMTRAGVDLSAVERQLDRRERRMTRRTGDAKPGSEEAS